MLFHVTMSHTVDNCPIYHKDSKEMMPKMIEAAEGLEGMAEGTESKNSLPNFKPSGTHFFRIA